MEIVEGNFLSAFTRLSNKLNFDHMCSTYTKLSNKQICRTGLQNNIRLFLEKNGNGCDWVFKCVMRFSNSINEILLLIGICWIVFHKLCLTYDFLCFKGVFF